MVCLLFQIVIVKIGAKNTKEKVKSDAWMGKKFRGLRRFRMFSFQTFIATKQPTANSQHHWQSPKSVHCFPFST
jgi:hypothetical protein